MRLARLTKDHIAPEAGAPSPEKRVKGDPRFRTWNMGSDGGLHWGIWECTPGAFRLDYTEWEYCRILSGRALITGEDGSRLEVGPGDSFVIRPGFRGVWETLETVTKDYVIRE
jgi:hypothetical protein